MDKNFYEDLAMKEDVEDALREADKLIDAIKEVVLE